MAGSAVPETVAPLTRRQIREAERAREAAEAARAAQDRADAEARAAQQRADAEARAAQQRADAESSAARQLPAEAPRTRAALRAAARERAEGVPAFTTSWTLDVPPVAAPAPRVVPSVAAPAPRVVAVAPTVVAVVPAPPVAPEAWTAADDAETAASPAESGEAIHDDSRAGSGEAIHDDSRAGSGEAVHDADRTATEVLTGSCSLPSRRELRSARGTTRPTDSRPPARAWAPRAAVLGAMGVLTIVAPLTGFGAPENPAFARSISGVQANATVLAILDEHGTSAALETVPDSLMKDPTASSRAMILETSRAADRNALECAPLDGASGARAAVTDEVEDQVVRPVADGTYRSSSRYGYRVHPITGAYNLHTGTDFAASLGTPIHAMADGTVEYVGPGKDGRSSMLVILRHEIGGETVYSWHVHMYADGIKVTEGQQVKVGDVIAEVGNNGNSTGPHLHFELHLDEEGATTDPLAWLEEHGAVEVSVLC